MKIWQIWHIAPSRLCTEERPFVWARVGSKSELANIWNPKHPVIVEVVLHSRAKMNLDVYKHIVLSFSLDAELLYDWRTPIPQCLIWGFCDFNHDATDAVTSAAPLLSSTHLAVMYDAINFSNWKDPWDWYARMGTSWLLGSSFILSPRAGGVFSDSLRRLARQLNYSWGTFWLWNAAKLPWSTYSDDANASWISLRMDWTLLWASVTTSTIMLRRRMPFAISQLLQISRT